VQRGGGIKSTMGLLEETQPTPKYNQNPTQHYHFCSAGRTALTVVLAHIRGLIVVSLLGMAIPFFCSDMLIKVIIGSDADVAVFTYAVYSLSLFLVAATPWLWRHLFNRRLPIETLSTISSIALCLAYLSLAAMLIWYVPVFLYAAVFLGSIGVAGCYAKWFSLFAAVPLKTATVTLLLAYTLGSLLRLLVSYLVTPLALVVAVVLVAAMQLSFLRTLRSFKPTAKSSHLSELGTQTLAPASHNTDSGLASQMQARRLIPFISVLMLYSLTLALMRSVNIEAQYLITPQALNLMLRAGFPLVLLFFIVLRHRIIKFTTLYQVSLILVVTTVLIIRLFSESNTVLAVALTSFIRGLIILFLFLSLIQVVQNRAFNPFTVVGISWGVYVLAQGLGLFASLRLGFELDGDLVLNITYLLVVLSSVVLLVMGHRIQDDSPPTTATDISIAADTKSVAAPVTKRLVALQQRYGLTEREVEILELICKGRSKSHIAQTLFISENTVRGHAKNLHMKCGVHSKQALIDLCMTQDDDPNQ